MELEELSEQVHQMYRAYLEAVRLPRVGLKETSDAASVFKRYPAVYDAKTVESAKKNWKASKGEEAERWRILYFFCQGLALDRASVEMGDELLNAEMGAAIEIDGKTTPYFSARNILYNEPDFEKREEINAAMLHVVSKTNPVRKKIVEAEFKELRTQTGTKSATEYLTEEKRMDYPAFLSMIKDAVSRTESLYMQHAGAWAKDRLGKPLGEISRAHQGYFLKMSDYDELFPGQDLMMVCGQTLENLGCDLAKLPQIKIDDSDRPKKNPRASCIASDPPKEVHLIIKPSGGADDYHQFLHEAGHALHFALVDPTLPYEMRGLGTSNALTEVYSFLLESLTRNPEWLRQYLGLGEELAWEVAYYTSLVDLTMFRRYSGKFEYELAFNESPTDWRRNSQTYQEILSRNTGFIYSSETFLDDMDAGLYSADYLRAWIASAQLRRHLTKKYGEKWFMSAKTGEFLKGLWKKGLSIENEDISKMIGAKPFDTAALLAEYHEVLTSNPI